MYPFIRLAFTLLNSRRLPPMDPLDLHVSQHRCWPVDCDIFMEMNNGRILTLYEMGRFQASVRMGLWPLLKKNRWGLTVAGTSIRYRRRITPFERYETRTKIATWDERFVYIEQGMYKTSTNGPPSGRLRDHARAARARTVDQKLDRSRSHTNMAARTRRQQYP